MKKDPMAFRKRFAAWKEGKSITDIYDGGLPKYDTGTQNIQLGDNPTNATVYSDNTFVDDFTRLFDDVVVTPKGARIKSESVHKYQEPWDENKFLNIITLGGLNNLSPSQWARRAYDLQNGNLTAESWLYGNTGVVPDKFAQEHPNYALAANTLFDFWALGGNSLLKNARNYATIARTPYQRYKFSFSSPDGAGASTEPVYLNSPKYAELDLEPTYEGLHEYPIEEYNRVPLIRGNEPLGRYNAIKLKIRQITPPQFKVDFGELPPEATYTGDVASNIISRSELGLNSGHILNPDIYPHRQILLPKPTYLDETLVDRNGNVNIRNVTKMVKDFYKQHPNAKSYKYINNSSGNLYNHIKDVVKSAQSIPVPEGYTRQELVQAALFHDIGKVFDSSKNHGHESVDMLDMLGINTSDNVKNAVYNHMTRSILDKDELTKALHFADVARGLGWDEAAYRYPHLTYKFKKPNLNIEKIPLREELKTRINPWLKNKGYETIKLDLPEEQAWEELEKRIDQHLSFLRGVRDPLKENPTSADDIRNAVNSINSVIDEFGLDPDYAKSRDAAKYRMQIAGTHIPLSPTSGGRRSHLYGDTGRYHDVTEYTRTSYSDMIGANPKTKDALYLSTSNDVAAQYGTANTDNREGAAYIVRLPKKERIEGESMSEHLLKNDFDMINLNALHGRKKGGFGATFEDPYRLQTGRSLIQDMIKEGVLNPKFIEDPDVVVREGNTIQYYGGNISFDNIDIDRSRINTVLHKMGIDFQINKSKDGAIYMPKKLIDLRNTMDAIEAAKDFLTPRETPSTQMFDETTRQQLADLMEFDSYDLNDPIAQMFGFNNSYLRTPLSKMDEAQRDALVAQLTAMNDPNYLKYAYADNPAGIGKQKKFYDNSFPKKMLDRLEAEGLITKRQINATRKAWLHDGDALKYIDFKKIANKALTRYLQSVKANKNKVKFDPTSVKPSVQQMIDFMRSKGVVPRYEIEGYGDNKVYVIEANEKNKTKNAGDIKRTYGYILGDKGQKVVDIADEITFDKKYNPDHVGKDNGSYSKNKISRKTLRTIGTAVATGSTLKRPKRNNKNE